MNILTAHELLAQHNYFHPLEAWFPDDLQDAAGFGSEYNVAMLTAAAELSGRLEECETLDDLREACEHFKFLFSGEVVEIEEWCWEGAKVMLAIQEWGDKVTQAAEWN